MRQNIVAEFFFQFVSKWTKWLSHFTSCIVDVHQYKNVCVVLLYVFRLVLCVFIVYVFYVQHVLVLPLNE